VFSGSGTKKCAVRPLEALQRLVDNHLMHREMLVFLVF
ncbi:hypothetical protein Pgy4_40465, partial [Pseudomonas savastanoi pv. glycinea str. race 4]